MNISRKSVRSIFALFFSILMLLVSIGIIFDSPVFAANSNVQQDNELQTGDVLKLREGDWEREFIVLNPSKTNTGKPGLFLIQKEVGDKVAFNFDLSSDEYLNVANLWEGSLSQRWCEQYYRNLPAQIKDAVIGVKTVETESGSDWAGVNNIDGTRSDNDGYEKDKVFYLSYIEYDTYRDSAGLVDPENKWHLRAPYNCGDLAVYVCIVTETGRVMEFGHTDKIGTRPAFNLNPDAMDAAVKCRHGNKATWIVDGDASQGGYRDIKYTWADNLKSCKGEAICNVCGEEIEESAIISSKVTKAATTTSTGVMTHTAKFTKKPFTTQTKKTTIAKKKPLKKPVQKPVKKLDPKMPKPVITAPASAKKSFTAKWKKLSKANQKKVHGVEVQYALNSKFTKKPVIKTAGKTKTSLKLKGLKSKKYYWVRVRTYRKSAGNKYYSKWSKVKRVKVK